MKKSEKETLLKRIEQLELRVAAIEAKPVFVPSVWTHTTELPYTVTATYTNAKNTITA
jgi:hypothetical protein